MTIDYNQLLGPKYNGSAEIAVEPEGDNVVEPKEIVKPSAPRGRPKK